MLNANALTTPDRLAGFMNITTPTGAQLTVMQSIINSLSTFIEQYTKTKFKKATYSNEEYSTEKGQTLNLKHFPIVSGQAFVLERRDSNLNEDRWETIDSLYYSVDEDAGIIELMGDVRFFRTRNGYRVSYTAGYDFDNSSTFLGDTAAADVEVALWMMASDVWFGKSGDNTVKSERIGDYSVTYANLMGIMLSNPQAQLLLAPYINEGGEMGVLTPLQNI